MGVSSNVSMNLDNSQQGSKGFTSTMKLPKPNLGSAYKINKIPYKGTAVHKQEFHDIVQCVEANQRQQLSDPKLEAII